MLSSKTAHNVAQEPLTSFPKNPSGAITTRDDRDEIKSPKQHTRDLFAWLNQVAADPELPSSAFKVAYIIGNYINRESGDAWPSSDRIARDCALSQPSVVAMTSRLRATGHLEVEPGAPGRGHSNRYRMIRKHQPADAFIPRKHRPADASASRKASGSRAESIRPAQIKHQPADMNFLKNNLQNHQERAYGPRSADDDRLSIASNSAKAAIDAPLNPAFAAADEAAKPAPMTQALRPIPRAAGAARIEAVADQKQPCQAASEMGRAANANAAPATSPRG